MGVLKYLWGRKLNGKTDSAQGDSRHGGSAPEDGCCLPALLVSSDFRPRKLQKYGTAKGWKTPSSFMATGRKRAVTNVSELLFSGVGGANATSAAVSVHRESFSQTNGETDR